MGVADNRHHVAFTRFSYRTSRSSSHGAFENKGRCSPHALQPTSDPAITASLQHCRICTSGCPLRMSSWHRNEARRENLLCLWLERRFQAQHLSYLLARRCRCSCYHCAQDLGHCARPVRRACRRSLTNGNMGGDNEVLRKLRDKMCTALALVSHSAANSPSRYSCR